MSVNPKITVIVPTFNRPRMLKRALESISNQSFQDFECIVVDDCSTFEIFDVAKHFGPRFRMLRNISNIGISGTRLVGFRSARGEYLAQLDDDNRFYPWALERMNSILDKVEDIDGVSGLYVFHNGIRVSVPYSGTIITPESYSQGVYANCDMVACVRKNVVQDWLNKSSEYRSLDGHLWITHHMSQNHMYVGEPWGEYLEDAPNRITKQKTYTNSSDLEIFAKEHEPIFGTKPNIPLDQFMITQRLRYRRNPSSDTPNFQKWLTSRGYPLWKIYFLRGKKDFQNFFKSKIKTKRSS